VSELLESPNYYRRYGNDQTWSICCHTDEQSHV